MSNPRHEAILNILASGQVVNCTELAEMLQVSRRTITRDVRALARSGVPIISATGKDGGIWLSETAQPAAMLSPEDPVPEEFSSRQDVRFLVDAADTRYLADIETALESGRPLRFKLHTAEALITCRVEPYLLLNKGGQWALWAYDLGSGEFRMFPLRLMQEVRIFGHSFEKRLVPVPIWPTEPEKPLQAVIRADGSYRWQLVNQLGARAVTEGPDGLLTAHCGFDTKQELFGWVLSFEGKACLLEPEELTAEFAKISEVFSNC